jgi:hypothetical protein
VVRHGRRPRWRAVASGIGWVAVIAVAGAMLGPDGEERAMKAARARHGR